MNMLSICYSEKFKKNILLLSINARALWYYYHKKMYEKKYDTEYILEKMIKRNILNVENYLMN